MANFEDKMFLRIYQNLMDERKKKLFNQILLIKYMVKKKFRKELITFLIF